MEPCTQSNVSFPFRYWHRSLNPKKLIEVRFSHLSRNMTMQRTVKLYRLPEVRTSNAVTIMDNLLFSEIKVNSGRIF